ncbi:MAG TPA: AbrB/MazE/SpoVT family DNA-binding domain-containing protein [Thermoplasmata archaeon]|nr:AbrB/MazE/SpoVT family DNA-binding domain-containing protein [Thermoplasmata archaeon]
MRWRDVAKAPRPAEEASGPSGFTRRVQRTGSSSLSITLPKAWTDSMNLQTGDTLRFRDLGEGRLEISPTGGEGPSSHRQKVLRIDASGAPPRLLARLLIGAYITGQDRIVLTAPAGISPDQRAEVRRTVAHVLGMTVVEEDSGALEVQNFVDPGKYHFHRLLSQVVRILRTELATCRSVLQGAPGTSLEQLGPMEDEVDRFYLLMVRQLLLSSDDFQIARDIGVESHHYQIGNRLIAKVLEVTGDLTSGVAHELGTNLAGLRRMPKAALAELVALTGRVDGLLEQTMDAFSRLSVVDANSILNEIDASSAASSTLGDALARRVADRGVAVAAQRIVSHLLMTLEMLVIINEVTINRSVEPETVAKTDRKVVMRTRGRGAPDA